MVNASLKGLIGKANLSLGVSIQDGQYRRTIGFDKFTFNRKSEDQDCRRASRISEFIDATDKNDWLFGFKACEVSSDIKAFAPKWIYRYVKIGEKVGQLSTEHIIDAAVADLKYAVKLLCDNDYIARYRSWSGS